MSARPNIVLVHGAWADGSCWSAVVESLQAEGFTVTAPQFPETSLADDVARLRQVLKRQDGPTVVVGHSYRGQIITALGPVAANRGGLVYIPGFRLHERESIRALLTQGPPPPAPAPDAPNVVGRVCFAAFGPGEGESIGAVPAQGPPAPALAHLDIDELGFAWLPEDDFVQHFAADVDPAKARVMYAVQQALSASTLQDVMGPPAWKSFPSWYLVATADEAIPPDAERQFAARMGATTVEVASSHVPMVSQPAEVVKLVQAAVEGVTAAG